MVQIVTFVTLLLVDWVGMRASGAPQGRCQSKNGSDSEYPLGLAVDPLVECDW